MYVKVFIFSYIYYLYLYFLKEWFTLTKTFADDLLTHVIQYVHVFLSFFLMKTFQDFSPYNALQWESNGSRSKRHFQYKLQTVQRALKRF